MSAKDKLYQTEYLHPEHGWTVAHHNRLEEAARIYAKPARDNWHVPTRIREIVGWSRRIIASYRHP